MEWMYIIILSMNGEAATNKLYRSAKLGLATLQGYNKYWFYLPLSQNFFIPTYLGFDSSILFYMKKENKQCT
jgi:hypothetical protein